jgi:hypothetical protein
MIWPPKKPWERRLEKEKESAFRSPRSGNIVAKQAFGSENGERRARFYTLCFLSAVLS